MSDPFLLALVGVAGLAFGALVEQVRAGIEAENRAICPTCIGPTDDDGMSEAWGDGP